MLVDEPIVVAALEIQQTCQSAGWRFCLIGGLAYQRWGDPRATNDVDLTLLTGFGGEEPYIEALLAQFTGRTAGQRQFAPRSRVLLLTASNGTGIDVGLGALPFEARTIERATPWRLAEEVSLVTCCAEDLVVHKAFAGRGQDWVDVEKVVMRQAGALDRDLVWSELEPLIALHDDPEPRRRNLTAIFDKWPA